MFSRGTQHVYLMVGAQRVFSSVGQCRSDDLDSRAMRYLNVGERERERDMDAENNKLSIFLFYLKH